jgi:hypothetical protein
MTPLRTKEHVDERVKFFEGESVPIIFGSGDSANS